MSSLRLMKKRSSYLDLKPGLCRSGETHVTDLRWRGGEVCEEPSVAKRELRMRPSPIGNHPVADIAVKTQRRRATGAAGCTPTTTAPSKSGSRVGAQMWR